MTRPKLQSQYYMDTGAMRFTSLMVVLTNICFKMNRPDIETENMWMARKDYHSEGGKAPRKQGHHQLRRYQQCGASVGNTALTPAASPLHLTIPEADVATSQPFYLGIEGSASLLELTRDSAVRTSEHTCFLKLFVVKYLFLPKQFQE